MLNATAKRRLSPSVADRIALWRRLYATLAELASRIDADTQGKIISAVHSRIPIVTPDEQRAPRVRPRPEPEKALRHEGAKERPQNKAPIAEQTADQRTDAGTLPFARMALLPTAEQEGMQIEHAQTANERAAQAANANSVEERRQQANDSGRFHDRPRSLTSIHSVPLASADRGAQKRKLLCCNHEKAMDPIGEPFFWFVKLIACISRPRGRGAQNRCRMRSAVLTTHGRHDRQLIRHG